MVWITEPASNNELQLTCTLKSIATTGVDRQPLLLNWRRVLRETAEGLSSAHSPASGGTGIAPLLTHHRGPRHKAQSLCHVSTRFFPSPQMGTNGGRPGVLTGNCCAPFSPLSDL